MMENDYIVPMSTRDAIAAICAAHAADADLNELNARVARADARTGASALADAARAEAARVARADARTGASALADAARADARTGASALADAARAEAARAVDIARERAAIKDLIARTAAEDFDDMLFDDEDEEYDYVAAISGTHPNTLSDSAKNKIRLASEAYTSR
jgi:hypothetical protein